MTSAFSEPPDTRVITIRRAAGTIVVRPAPRREPPFDDELDATATRVGPYDRPLPFARARRRRIALPPAPPSAMRAALPDPGAWGRRLLVGIIETAAGRLCVPSPHRRDREAWASWQGFALEPLDPAGYDISEDEDLVRLACR